MSSSLNALRSRPSDSQVADLLAQLHAANPGEPDDTFALSDFESLSDPPVIGFNNVGDANSAGPAGPPTLPDGALVPDTPLISDRPSPPDLPLVPDTPLISDRPSPPDLPPDSVFDGFGPAFDGTGDDPLPPPPDVPMPPDDGVPPDRPSTSLSPWLSDLL